MARLSCRGCSSWFCLFVQQLEAEVELAWSRAGAVSTVQQRLDSAFAQLQSQIEVDRRSVDALAAAVALLCGAIYRLSARASELAAQRTLLTEQLQRFDAFKQQVPLINQHLYLTWQKCMLRVKSVTRYCCLA